jgi:hypothetical protein
LVGCVRVCFPLALLACVLVTGCLAHDYEIGRDELQRLLALPSEERGGEIRVTQQTSFSSDLRSGDPRADLTLELSAEEAYPSDWNGHHRDHHERKHDDAGGAQEALAAIVVGAVVASTVLVTAAATEGARFDGWLAAPVTQPLLLIDGAGQRRWSRLDALTVADLTGVDHAVLPELGSELVRLGRAPLDRRGFVYQLELGTSELDLGSSGATLGSAGRAALGFMPRQDFGLLLGAAFGTASAAPASPATDSGTGLATQGDAQPGDELDVEYRGFLLAEYWPLHVRRLHLGAFAELGTGRALRSGAARGQRGDEPFARRSVSGTTLGAGLALQLELSTRLAATLRAGAFALPSLDRQSTFLTLDGYRVAPALTLGMAVY